MFYVHDMATISVQQLVFPSTKKNAEKAGANPTIKKPKCSKDAVFGRTRDYVIGQEATLRGGFFFFCSFDERTDI